MQRFDMPHKPRTFRTFAGTPSEVWVQQVINGYWVTIAKVQYQPNSFLPQWDFWKYLYDRLNVLEGARFVVNGQVWNP